MSLSSPTLSIAMAVRNNASTVDQAVRSIVNQTFTDWELLIANDGSIDATRQIIESYTDSRIRLINHESSCGLPVRLNQLLDQCASKYWGRMDGDDLSHPERLRLQVAFLESYPQVDLVGSSVAVIDQESRIIGKREYPTDHSDIVKKPWSGFPMAHPTFVGRTEFFSRYRYREDLARAQDQDLLLRSYESSTFANLPELLYAYRDSDVSLRKQFWARWYKSKSLFQTLKAEGKPAIAARAALEQYLKLGVDALAVSTRLDRRVFRHRAQEIDADELGEWETILMGSQEVI